MDPILTTNGEEIFSTGSYVTSPVIELFTGAGDTYTMGIFYIFLAELLESLEYF